MILAEKPLNVTTSGIKSKTFGIALNRKMFRILSADLYSDKIKAVIRELSTNAADAHVVAGNTDKPFHVHLPNAFEPYFEVKDFGTGLSNDRMYSLYTQYGVSDKTESNDVTGCLGLGSKSPFAYTDSFTVESRFNGTKTVFTAYLNESGFPALSDPLTSDPTDEPNGLTVRFPVKASDFNQFVNKAVEALRWFKVRPTVGGNSNFSYPAAVEYLRDTAEYRLPKERTGQSYVVMGNVAYPIDTNQVVGYYDRKDGDQEVRALLSWGVELYVKIGDVDFTASRETLSYDDDEDSNKRTVPFIKAACLKAIKDLETHVTKDIASKPTIWEARRALYEIRRSFNGFNFNAVWGGQTITDNVKVPADKALCETLKRKTYKGDKLQVAKDRSETIHADGSKVFINDGRGGYAAIRRYLETVEQGTRVYLLGENTDAEWLKETGLDTVVVKTSTLPKPPRQVGLSRGGAAKAKVYELTYMNSSTASDHWKPAEIDLEDDSEFVYVEILYFNYRTKADGPTSHPNDLKNVVRLLETVTGKTVKVYGIRPSDRKNVIEKSEGTWVSLDDYAKRVREEVGVKLHAEAVKAVQYQQLSGNTRDMLKLDKFKFGAESKFGAYLKTVRDSKGANEKAKVSEYLKLYRLTGGEDFKDADALSNEQEAVYATYPMLSYVNWYSYGDEFYKTLADYIKDVDAKSGN